MTTREVSERQRVAANTRRFAQEKLIAFLREKGLRMTPQRQVILETIMSLGGHADADRIAEAVGRRTENVSRATVYRTLQLMCDVGIIRECHFDRTRSIFEIAEFAKEHHDHIICTRCQRVVEFVNPQLEHLQHSIAQELGFVMESHRLIIHGRCNDSKLCKSRNNKKG